MVSKNTYICGQEIDDLCQEAVLEKVDYKGSISFRITSEKKLHKRVGRRKNSIHSPGESGLSPPEEHVVTQQPRAPSPKKIKKSARKPRDSPANKMDPVTLNLLLREELNINTEAIVTKDNLVQALDLTKRPINKRAVFRDLETILAHEIHLGYLVKRADSSLILASINKDKHYRGTIPLKSSKRKPKPTQKYLEMEAELQKNKPDSFKEMDAVDSEASFTIASPPNDSSQVKSEEELKDDLIKEKLISSNILKIKSKMKSSKTGKQKSKKDANPLTEVCQTAPAVEIIPICADKTVEVQQVTQPLGQENNKPVLTAIKSKPKKEEWQVSITVKEPKVKASTPAELEPTEASLTDSFILSPPQITQQDQENTYHLSVLQIHIRIID